VLPGVERIMISAALRQAGRPRKGAAKLVGCGRNTLTRQRKELGMDQDT
jgi:two-component system nitrogen regulation response regulator GlnG